MGKSIFAVEDWSAVLSSIACAQADAAYPVENLLTTQVRSGGDRLRTTSAAEMVITMERVAAAPMSSLWAIAGNQGARASWRVVGKVGGSGGSGAFDTAPFGAGVWLGLDGASNSVIAGSLSWTGIQSFSLSCRIRPDLIRRQGILQLGGTANAYVTMSPDGTLRFWGSNGSEPLRGNLSSVTKAQAGTEYRLDATYDHTAGRLTLYVDGLPEATISGVLTLVDLPTGIAMGQTDVSSFAGIIDDVRLWNHERSAAQVLADAFTELVGTESGLVSYHKLNNSYLNSVAGAPTASTVGTAPIFAYPERFWWSPNIGFEKFRTGAYVYSPGWMIDWLQVSILDPENTVGYQSLGRLMVSAAWVTGRGRRRGGRYAPRGGSSRTLLPGSTPVRRERPRLAQRHQIVITEEYEAMLADRIFRVNGDGRGVVLAHDFDDETYRHQKLVYGFIDNCELTDPSPGFWTYDFDILEV